MLSRKRRYPLASSARKGRRARPSVEVLEGRSLLATVFADRAIDFFDSRNGPIPGPYGFQRPGSTPTPVDLGVVLGDDSPQTPNGLSLPTGTFVTVGFPTPIVDRPGTDLVVYELDDAGERANVFARSETSGYVFLGVATAGTGSEFDLANIGFFEPVVAVRVIGLDNGGDSPGFDVARVAANVPDGAEPPLRILGTSPLPGSSSAGGVASITLTFSSQVEPATRWPGAFQLLASGGDGSFGEGNEVPVPITNAVWDAAARSLHLGLDGFLPRETYRLIAFDLIQSAGGARLDGDFSGAFPTGNGQAGGAFVMTFGVTTAPPSALGIQTTAVQTEPLPLTLLAVDRDRDALTFRIVSPPQHGTIAPAPGGGPADFVYTPEPTYSGPDSFTFVANDGRADSAPATVSLQVASGPVDLVPTTLNVVAPAGIAPGRTLRLDWLARNLGPGTTADFGTDWIDQLYLSSDATLDGADVRLGSGEINASPLAPGQPYTGSAEVTLPLMPEISGDVFLLLEVNSTVRQRESNRTNNVLAQPIRINPAIVLDAPYSGQFVDGNTPVRFAWRDVDAAHPATVRLAIDADNNPANGIGHTFLATDLPEDADGPGDQRDVTLPRLSPGTYFVWASIVNSEGEFFSTPVPVSFFEQTFTSIDQAGDAIGGAGFEVFGAEIGRNGDQFQFRVRTNYTGPDPGDIYLNLGGSFQSGGGQVLGLAMQTRNTDSGQRVSTGRLYRGATFEGGTVVGANPAFINTFATEVAGQSSVSFVPVVNQNWRAEISGTFTRASLGLTSPATLQLASTMYCGNDIDDVVTSPLESSEPPTVGQVDIYINSPETENDDIAIFNQIPLAQAITQTVQATIRNNGPGGVIQLAVTPNGAAILSQDTVSLAANGSVVINITPNAVSSSVNDVHIIAMRGGVQVGEEDMTIVSIVMDRINARNTPDGMTDRIPPRVETFTRVEVQPNLGNSGQAVFLTIEGQSRSNGFVSINDMDDPDQPAIITSSLDISLRGLSQTEPGGNAGNLRLVAGVRDDQPQVRSNGFSVAAIPVNFRVSGGRAIVYKFTLFDISCKGQFPNPQSASVIGMVVTVSWDSDSGELGDLDQVELREVVRLVSATGSTLPVFNRPRGTSQDTQTDEFQTICFNPASRGKTDDYHTLPLFNLQFARGPGEQVRRQAHEFTDARTATFVPVFAPHSGFEIRQTVIGRDRLIGFLPRRTLTSLKSGTTVMIDGRSTDGGFGIATVTQSIPTAHLQDLRGLIPFGPLLRLDTSSPRIQRLLMRPRFRRLVLHIT
jgi:hypothetical protein